MVVLVVFGAHANIPLGDLRTTERCRNVDKGELQIVGDCGCLWMRGVHLSLLRATNDEVAA